MSKDYPTKDGTVIRHKSNGEKQYIHPATPTAKGTRQVTYTRLADKKRNSGKQP